MTLVMHPVGVKRHYSTLGGMAKILPCILLVHGALTPLAAQDSSLASADRSAFVFRDEFRISGLHSHLSGIRGHGAAWGDADGDGRLDLYVATFHTDGPPNTLLRNRGGKFELDDQSAVRISTRATGVLFADFDNDGDLDLYVASMPAPAGSRLAQRVGHALAGCSMFRNDGNGKFTNISEGSGACPREFGGRSATVLDFDGDGLLDLLVGEDPLPGYNGSKTKSSRVFRNLGRLQFQDVSRALGLPEGVPGLGVAAADLNQDGWPDFFLTSNGGGNRLFLNDKGHRYREATGSRETFEWPTALGDNMVCGVAFGDVNRDGLMDVVLGQHYERPWREPVANRLYLHRGVRQGVPAFEDVTQRSGLPPLPMKSPHLEIQDLDNDGWPDISTSVVKFDGKIPHPVIFRHSGMRDGLPQFHCDALAVNGFPNDQEKAITRPQELFDKINRDRTIFYSAPAPVGDYDQDGRLDMFLPSWWPESASLLLHNETTVRNWLDVRVEGREKINRQGIGCLVNIFATGRLGEEKSLLGCREISVGFGYASGQAAVAHFGLDDSDVVDVEIVLPHGLGQVIERNVKANQIVVIMAP